MYFYVWIIYFTLLFKSPMNFFMKSGMQIVASPFLFFIFYLPSKHKNHFHCLLISLILDGWVMPKIDSVHRMRFGNYNNSENFLYANQTVGGIFTPYHLCSPHLSCTHLHLRGTILILIFWPFILFVLELSEFFVSFFLWDVTGHIT